MEPSRRVSGQRPLGPVAPLRGAGPTAPAGLLIDAIGRVIGRLRASLVVLFIALVALRVVLDATVPWDLVGLLGIVAVLGWATSITRTTRDRPVRGAFTLEVLGDSAAAIGCLVLIDTSQTPLGWLVMAVPVLNATIRHSLALGGLVWIGMTVANVAYELTYRAGAEGVDALLMGGQQLIAVALLAGPAIFLVRQLVEEADRRGAARAEAEIDAMGVARVAAAAKTISAADTPERAVAAALSATRELGFIGAEAYEPGADGTWSITSKGSNTGDSTGGPLDLIALVDQSRREVVVDASHSAELAQILHGRRAQAVVIVPVLRSRLVLCVYAATVPNESATQWTRLLAEHLSVAWFNVRKAHELAERAAELSYRATHDNLTGLPNRSFLVTTLDRLLADREPVSLLFIDLDGFKAVNDIHGHDAGDHVLVTVGSRVRAVLRDDMLLGRLGGDEFLIVLGGGVANYSQEVADRVMTAVSQPIEWHGSMLSVGSSIGVSVAAPGDEAHRVLRRADEAMYAAKRSGGSRVQTSS